MSSRLLLEEEVGWKLSLGHGLSSGQESLSVQSALKQCFYKTQSIPFPAGSVASVRGASNIDHVLAERGAVGSITETSPQSVLSAK